MKLIYPICALLSCILIVFIALHYIFMIIAWAINRKEPKKVYPSATNYSINKNKIHANAN